jgi:hypothetical protein
MVLDPRYIWEPLWKYADPTVPGWRLAGHIAAWSIVGAGCFLLAVWRMRPAYFRQLEGPNPHAKSRWSWLVRPPVGDDPVRWRERHVVGLASMPGMRFIPRWPVLIVVAITALYIHLDELIRLPTGDQWFSWTVWVQKLTTINADNARSWFITSGGGAAVLMSVIVALRCAEAINGEKEKKTWEGLLMTPLTGRQLVHSKLWGILAATGPYLGAYAIPTIGVACLCGSLCIVVALAWIAAMPSIMIFVAAMGLFCSATIRQSWQSLLATLAGSILGGLLICGATFVLCAPIIVELQRSPTEAAATASAIATAVIALVGFFIAGIAILEHTQTLVRELPGRSNRDLYGRRRDFGPMDRTQYPWHVPKNKGWGP